MISTHSEYRAAACTEVPAGAIPTISAVREGWLEFSRLVNGALHSALRRCLLKMAPGALWSGSEPHRLQSGLSFVTCLIDTYKIAS